MRLLELSLLYALVGVGCSVVLLTRRPPRDSAIIDAILMVGLWPIYAPFALTRDSHLNGFNESSDVDFLVALRRVHDSPLAALLPDQSTVSALARRLRVATSKVAEIDQLLNQPEFSEPDAIARQADLKARGSSECAISTAAMRLSNIRRLRSMRDRFARELDEVRELLAQLKTQADVVRLAGSPADETRDLVQEIISRVEGLDRMIDDDPFGSLDPVPSTRKYSA